MTNASLDELSRLRAENARLSELCAKQKVALDRLATMSNEGKVILLEYPVQPKVRFGYDQPLHQPLVEYLQARTPRFLDMIAKLEALVPQLEEISPTETSESLPYWTNPWLNHADAAMLCTFLHTHRPKHYVEIGSGFSTKYARWAIDRFGLSTKITSIDPQPRAVIDTLCDEVVREPLEACDITPFEDLEAGDIVFYDGSHRSFQNSDVTVFFLELLPKLKPGVIWHIHDIFLPMDYPAAWKDRYYNEQYLLAAALLAGPTRYDVAFSNPFLACDEKLHTALANIAAHPVLGPIARGGGSYWCQMQ